MHLSTWVQDFAPRDGIGILLHWNSILQPLVKIPLSRQPLELMNRESRILLHTGSSTDLFFHQELMAGMQRYGGWVWSGDVWAHWETLAAQVPVGLNFSLSGSPFWGTDIGGFFPTKELTGELYVRWFQFGAFCPLFRSHGRAWHLRLPWGWSTGELGPAELDNFRITVNLHFTMMMEKHWITPKIFFV